MCDNSKHIPHTWTEKCEEVLNKQIHLELWASLQYHSLFAYFDRNCVGLNNIANFFNKSSLEEREHAHKLMTYQNKRGGCVKLTTDDKNCTFTDIEDISTIYNVENNKDVISAFEKALHMENIVYQSLLTVHGQGVLDNDPQFTDFIESVFLEEQIESISELSKYIAQLKRIGNDDGHGILTFDKELKV